MTYYRFHNSLPLAPKLRRVNMGHIFSYYVNNISCGIPPSSPRSSYYFSLKYSTKKPFTFFFYSIICASWLHISSSFITLKIYGDKYEIRIQIQFIVTQLILSVINPSLDYDYHKFTVHNHFKFLLKFLRQHWTRQTNLTSSQWNGLWTALPETDEKCHCTVTPRNCRNFHLHTHLTPNRTINRLAVTM